MNKEDYKLCYVYNSVAYFTTQDLSKQWGDDWDDAPYEHNAETPYNPCWHNEKDSSLYPCNCDICKRDWNEDGTPKWEILEVKIVSDLEEPCDNHTNSPYSVRGINKGKVPWLKGKEISIYAGISLKDFEAICKMYKFNIISINKFKN